MCVLQVTAEQNASVSHQPMFITELMLDTHSLSYQPSMDDFQVCVSETQKKVFVCFRHFLQHAQLVYSMCTLHMVMRSMYLCIHQECVAEITGRFENTVLSLDTLVQDTYFDAFTQPIINKKVKRDQHLPLHCIAHALL